MLTVFSALGQQAPKVVDIKLSKTISNAQPTLNQSITYTVYAKNEGPDTAKTVVVKDIFPTAGANLVSSTPSVGSFNAGLWTIPVISPGDSVKLEMTGTVIGRGVYFNIAEVVSMAAGQEDSDSDPNNGVLGEDDYATSCFSVPILWYPGDEYVVSLDVPGYTNVVWAKNGAPITGAPSDSSSVSGDTLTIKGTGRFGFTAQVNTCPATGCCEIIVIPGPLGSIGDFVWKDVNDNGQQDVGEPGVNNVLVRLYQKNDLGNFVQTDSTYTAGVGQYAFTGLLPGEYQVQFVSSTFLDGCVLSPKQNQGADSLDSDADPLTGFSQIVTINPEMGGLLKDNPTIDAGLYSPLGSIGNFVWKDTDNDGIQDVGEAGVNNVLVRLYKNVSSVFVQVDSMYTTANPVGSAPGWYTFNGLSAGDYQVQIVAASLPLGCVLSDSTNKGGNDALDNDFNPSNGFSQVVSLDPTKGGILQDNLTIDGALYSPLGSIGDFVWKDLNDNGQQDVGEPGVKNVRVILWTSNGTTPTTAIDTTFTDVNGYYSFTSLVGGTYQVQFDVTSLPDTCQLSLNQNVGSDVTDSDANPITGLTAAVVIDPTKSGIDKDNLTIDAGLTTFDLSLTKSLASGQSGNVAAGDTVTYTLTVKNEGSMTASAIALSDSLPVGMTLLDSDWTAVGQIATLNTALAGPLAPGASLSVDITVKVDASFAGTSLTNYAQISDARDVKGNPVKDVDSTPGNGFTKGEDDDDSEPINVTPLGSIGDFVWKDLNDNGQQNIGEPGVQNVKVILWSGTVNGPTAKLDSMLTDVNGKYLFTNLPLGTYYVQFDTKSLPDTCKLSLNQNVGSDLSDSDADPTTGISPAVVLTAENRNNLTIDAGLTTFDLSLTKSLASGQSGNVAAGDTVTYTLTVKNEGSMTASAIALSDSLPVGMTLLDSDWTAVGQIATLNTALAGPLAPGASLSVDITVKVDASFAGTSLTNYAQISDARDVKGNPVKDVDSTPGNGFTKGEDDDDSEPINVTPLGSIGDFVWKDLNDNGQQNIGEPGVQNVKVILWSGTVNGPTAKLDSMLTDVNGKYLFTNLPLGTYYVQFDTKSLPDTCKLSLNQNVGSDLSDSDADPTTGISPAVVLTAENRNNLTIDAGLTTFDLSLTKSLASGQSGNVAAGDTVTYTLTVKNEGSMTASAIALSDSLPVGMTLLDSDWTAVGQIATLNTALAGPLAPGASLSVDITVKVDASFAGTSLTNYAQISDARDVKGNPVKDVDSTPGNGFTKGEDDDDSEPINVTPLGSIGDFVWKDLNDNGQQNIGEPGVQNVKVILWSGTVNGPTAKLDSMLTDVNGKYLFTNLPLGTYYVQFDTKSLPDTCKLSLNQNVGSDLSDSDADPTTGISPAVVLTAENRNNLTIDAGLTTFDLSLTKSLASGQSGNVAAGDTVTYTLTVKNEGSMTASAIALSDSLPVGMTLLDSDWTAVGQIATLNTALAGPLAPGASLSVDITVKVDASFAGTSLTNYAQISDARDVKGNPVKDVDSTPGNGFTKGEDDDDSEPINVTPLGSIGDFVWKDLNDNGQQNIGEPGVQNVKVILWSGTVNGPTAKLDSMLTDVNGKYLFTNLPLGTYYVQFDTKSLPDTCKLSLNQNVGSDLSDSDADPTTGISPAVVLTAENRNNLTIDAGLTTFDLSLTKSLASGQSGNVAAGDTVTYTLTVKNEGSMTASAIALSDSLPVGMTLLDSDWTAVGQIATLNTALAGPLAPGASLSVDITVKVDASFAGTSLTNYAQISDARDVKGNPVKDVDSTPGNGFTKGEDDDDSEPINVTPLGSIGDFVWKDLNDNGQQNIGEPGVQNVKVILWSGTVNGPTAKLDSMLTDVNGKYLFTNLPLGTYYVQFDTKSLPDTCKLSLNQNVGSDLSDSDADPTTGISPAVVLTAENRNNLTIDAGLTTFDLSLTKSLASGQSGNVAAGDTVTYTLTVKNEGSMTASAIALSDSLPVGMTLLDSDWTAVGQIATLNTALAGPLAPGASLSVDITVKVDASFAGTSLTNYAQISDARDVKGNPVKDVDSTPGNGFTKGEDDDDSEPINVTPCVIPPTPTCGGMGENTCPDSCVNLASFIHSTIRTEGGYFEWYTTFDHQPGTKVLDPTKVCTSGDYYLFEVAKCGVYSNAALLKLTIKSCVRLTDLSVEKQVLEAGPYSVGQTITYNVVASNEGPNNATNVTVSDVLPASLTFVSADPAAEYNAATGVWTIGNLANAANRTLKISATINAVGSITNTAIVKSPDNDPTKAGNDTSRVTIKATCVQPEPPILACAVTEICPGDSSVIHALGCAGGTIIWSNQSTGASIVVKPLETTTYTAICKKNGCESGPSNSITIHVNSPTVPIISASPSTNICAGNSVTLTASNCAGTIVWSTGETGAQITVTPSANTTYSAYCRIGHCNCSLNTCKSNPAFVTITVTTSVPTPVVICSTDKVCQGQSVTLQVNNCPGIVEWSTGETGPAIVVYPTETTTYTAVCNVNGCKATSKGYTIKVAPIASPTVAATSTTICNGSSTTLTASGCEGAVTWSNQAVGASIVVSPTATTTYTAICTVGQCVSNPSLPITVTVGNPAAPIISTDSTLLCAGQSVTLKAVGTCDGTILWSNNMTGSTIVVTPPSTTEYTAVCKVGDCVSVNSNKVKITVTTTGPAPTVVASKPSICVGDSTTLTASNCAGTIIWNTGATTTSIVVKPSTTTTYTASCRTGGKCDSTPGSVTVTVGNNATPPTITVSPSSNVCAGDTVTLTAAGCAGTVQWSTNATGASIKVVVNQTTTYTAICKIGNCESAPGSATVTVVPVPEKPAVICSTDKVCPGESVTLQVNNCAGVVHWSTGATGPAIVVTPTETTIYTAVCKVGNCSSPISANYTIKVIPITPPIVKATPSSVKLGETSVLTAEGCAGTITWSNGMLGASIVVNPTETTSYTAVCKIGNCTSAASVPVTVTVGNCTAPSIVASSAVICEGDSVTLTAAGCEGGTIQWSNNATGNSIKVTPLGTTTYTAVCKKGDCTSSASNTVTVAVTKVYAPTIIASATTICKGDSVTLTATGCNGTLLWSNGASSTSIKVTPIATISYWVKCKVGNCESAATAPVTITVGTPAPPTIEASKTTLCYGESVTLTALGNCAGYIQWSSGQIGSTLTIIPAASTIYTAACCYNSICKSVASNAVNVIVSPRITAPVVVNLANVCPVKTVDLTTAVKNYTPNAGLVLEFHQTNSPSSPLVSNPLAVGVSGTYYAFFRSTAGCYSTGTAISVLISPCETTPCETNPATADAGADASICAALQYKLNGKIGGVATGAVWTTNGTGTFSNSLALDATYYPSLEDLIKGDVILTLTTNDPDGEGNCKAGVDAMKLIFTGIKFRPQIIVNGTFKADTLPETITICQGDTVKLKASENGYKVKWFKDGNVLFPASDGIRQWNVTEPGTYSYALVDDSLCCSVNSAYITVVVKSLPTPIVKNLRNDCPSNTVNLTTALEGNINYTTIFTSAAQPRCDCLVGTPEAVGAGTYFVTYKKDGCYSAPAAIEVKIFDCATDTLRSDLSITKTANKTLALIGEEVTYTIVVKNNGQHNATNVDVRDIMPTQLELISTSGLTNTGGVLKTRIPVIAAGDSTTLTVVTKAVTAGYNVINKAEVTYADQVDPNAANNLSSVGIVISDGTISPAIGVALAVDKIEKKGEGDTTSYDITYKITVKNVGNVPLTNVVLQDSITNSFVPPVTFAVLGAPVVETGSPLVPNAGYNGTTDKNILGPGSSLAVGAEETILITINVKPNGNSGPFLGSVIATANGNGTTVTDASNRGIVVNAPVNNPTPVRFDLPSAMIGLSKLAGTPVALGDGKFKIPYTISVTNLGTNDLKKIKVEDNLGLTFGNKAVIVGKPLVTADLGFVVDSSYTGQGLLTNLLVDSLSTLPKGTTRNINLAVVISLYNPDSVTTFNNIAIGAGYTEGGVMTADTSTTGDNADPDNDLDPRNNSESTPVSLNSTPGNGLLGLAMSIKDTVRKGDGSLNITYRVILKNYGAGMLNNVQVSDSLTKVYSSLTGASYQLVGTPTANDSSTLRINPDFNGDRDVNLLIAEQSRLAGGRSDSLFFTVNVTTDGRTAPYLNRAYGAALAGQNSIGDISTNGLNPDLNGNNDPTELTEAEYTPIVIPSDGGLFVPEGFSPNGDGINDKFVIRHPSGTKIVLEIYNRWMNLVYRNNDYQNDWEGSANVGIGANNQTVPVGTYFYNVILVDQNGGEIKKTSRFMTINR
ncbi:SdrD B-like domain-containing protein [Runella rosea]|nr:SdrD B-like domain-containing protein [Runella rosea]